MKKSEHSVRRLVRRAHLTVYAAAVIGVSVLLWGSAPRVLAADPAAGAADATAACEALARLDGFPVPATHINAAHLNAAGAVVVAGVPLPAHCQVNGIINKRVGTDGNPYGDRFEVRLPVPSQWNGRFMFQGGGGAEGTLPAATGEAGSLSPTLAHGWAVASQDGGHENSQLKRPFSFFFEHQALVDETYGSLDVTTQTAKYLIKSFYGSGPKHSYWVGCSTGGRQGMVMSQHFPAYFDGIIAGDPVYDLEAMQMSETWAGEQVQSIAPQPISDTPGATASWQPAFSQSDRELFTKAIMQACDALDGKVDGVIDDQPACLRKFHPSSFVFEDTRTPLQCAGAKQPTCLSRQQLAVLEAINQGPRDGNGKKIMAPAGAVAPDHADNTMQGYVYDGSFLTAVGIPSRYDDGFAKMAGVPEIPYLWVQPVDADADPLKFNFKTDLDKLTKENIQVTYSTSLDIGAFERRGGKIIWYHGSSDPGAPVTGTIAYYRGLAARNGGLSGVQKFARLYVVSQMGHCRGGAATDEFDLLTPLVAWVEQGTAPGAIVASGQHFPAPATTRQRPLCPYPQQVRFTGGDSGDLASASNYKCVVPKAGEH